MKPLASRSKVAHSEGMTFQPDPIAKRECDCCGSQDPSEVAGSYSTCCNEPVITRRPVPTQAQVRRSIRRSML